MSQSLYRLSMALPSIRLAYILGRFSGRLTEAVCDSMGFSGEEFRVRLDNELSLGFVASSVAFRSYLRMHKKDPTVVSALRYEDLVARPLETCRALMQFCGLPSELAELGVKGMEFDSQRTAPYQMRHMKGLWAPKLTKDMEGHLNDILKAFGLPPLSEFGPVDGTLALQGA